MKNILTFLLLIFFGLTKAQEDSQFIKTYTLYAEIKDGEFGEIYTTNVTFIFNYGPHNDVKMYNNNTGEDSLYTKVSPIRSGKRNDGTEYQYLTVLSDRGVEIELVLYDDNELRLYIGTGTYGFVFYEQ